VNGVPQTPIFKAKFNEGDNLNSVLRIRLRNNRMPPNFPFDITEANRDGACLTVAADGVKVVKDAAGELTYSQPDPKDATKTVKCAATAVGLIEAWVNAGAKEKDAFEYGGQKTLTFERDVLPFFTEADMWFKGSASCSSCHKDNTEASLHQMDLSSYKGIMLGGDVFSAPPVNGVPQTPIIKAGDFSKSVLRIRLRNNRMPPTMPFMLDESNRDGPIIKAGTKK